MKQPIVLGFWFAVALSAVPGTPHVKKSQVAKMTLKVGDTAPDFTLLSDQWKTVKLSTTVAGKMSFLPYTSWPSPAVERSNFRRSRLESPPVKIDTSDTEVFGVSLIVPPPTLRSPEIGITFPLLSDMNRKMLKTYGILKATDVKMKPTSGPCAPTSSSTSRASSNLSKRADSAVDPNTALTMCTTLHKKDADK